MVSRWLRGAHHAISEMIQSLTQGLRRFFDSATWPASSPRIAMNGNWRITFEFRDGHAYIIDYEDYH